MFPEGPTIEKKSISSDRVIFTIHTVEHVNSVLKASISNEIFSLD